MEVEQIRVKQTNKQNQKTQNELRRSLLSDGTNKQSRKLNIQTYKVIMVVNQTKHCPKVLVFIICSFIIVSVIWLDNNTQDIHYHKNFQSLVTC